MAVWGSESAGGGTGDMQASIFDTDSNNRVDNADYDNSIVSLLAATNVQDAIDELAGASSGGTPTVFTFQPGGTAGGNVYTSWTALMAAHDAADGYKLILGDATFGALAVPAGNYNFKYTTFEGMPAQIPTGGSQFDFADGTTFSEWPRFVRYCTLKFNNTSTVVYSCASLCIHVYEFGGIAQGAGATQEVIEIPNGAIGLISLLFNQVSFDFLGVKEGYKVGATFAGPLQFVMLGNSSFKQDGITGGAAANVSYSIDPTSSFDETQTNYSGVFTKSRPSDADNIISNINTGVLTGGNSVDEQLDALASAAASPGDTNSVITWKPGATDLDSNIVGNLTELIAALSGNAKAIVHLSGAGTFSEAVTAALNMQGRVFHGVSGLGTGTGAAELNITGAGTLVNGLPAELHNVQLQTAQLSHVLEINGSSANRTMRLYSSQLVFTGSGVGFFYLAGADIRVECYHSDLTTFVNQFAGGETINLYLMDNSSIQNGSITNPAAPGPILNLYYDASSAASALNYTGPANLTVNKIALSHAHGLRGDGLINAANDAAAALAGVPSFGLYRNGEVVQTRTS